MKKYLRILAALAFVLALVSCSEQDKMTGPDSGSDNADLLKASNSGAKHSISSLSVVSAEIGDELTINGDGFGAAKLSTSSVIIMGIPVSVYVSWTNTQIKVIVPSGAAAGTGTVAVKLRNKSSFAPSPGFELLPCSTVTIGGLFWTGANYDVSHYNNSTQDVIPQVTDATLWDNLTTGAWCYPNNDPVLGTFYGKLYNWYAVTDPRGFAPTGWHVPSDQEWKTLSIALGMDPAEADLPDLAIIDRGWYGTTEGGKMKEVGTSLWMYSNVGATNSSGFTALPAGMRSALAGYDFVSQNTGAMWWASTEADPTLKADAAWSRVLTYSSATTYRGALSKKHGFSVRFVQDY